MDSTTAHLGAIDRLRALPFPARRRTERGVESGPGFHVAQLEYSDRFGDDDFTLVRDAREEFEAELQVLVQVLTYRWGNPELMGLDGHLERSAMGEPVREPWCTLSAFVGEVHAWSVDGRWVALGISRDEPQSPQSVQLVAAIGDEAFVDGGATP
ncbi:hypothetical protein [Streptomyces sp. NPDC051776]|uniref:hypothetical protein n=1 Tax=Streptomyces sp. NPDC051776 TaxID=3155414 RepID=UPI00342D5526